MKKEANKKLIKKEVLVPKETIENILGGSVGFEGRDYKSDIKAIAKKDRIKEIEYTNPFTGTKTLQTIDRGGTSDEKLALVFSNPNSSDDLKLSTLSLYLFEKGKESSSFLVDLMQYKGKNTKEVREFKSQMRFDFMLFVNMFTHFLSETAQSIVDVVMPGKSVIELEDEALAYLRENEKKTIRDFITEKCLNRIRYENMDLPYDNDYKLIFLEMALKHISEAQTMKGKITEMAEQREIEKGKGIHIGGDGKAFRSN